MNDINAARRMRVAALEKAEAEKVRDECPDAAVPSALSLLS